jgi:uncharacterized protein YdaU (DUF1376 family)
MNYYAFHIGDYAGATRHLSWDEDMAYRRMLDAYYTREAPLPIDRRQLYRLIGAAEKRQREAVDGVLAEFFVETPDGWANARCDEEIAKAADKAAESGARKESEKERQRRHRARRKELFDKLRSHGVAPPFDTPSATLEEMVTQREHNAFVTRDETQTQRLTNPNPNPNPKRIDEVVARARDPDADLERKLRQAAGWQNEPSPKLAITGPIQALIDAGADLEQDVLPVIAAIAPGADGRSWNYFTKAIARARDQRVEASQIVTKPHEIGGFNGPGTRHNPPRSSTIDTILQTLGTGSGEGD